jgi:toxin ParE1/3/4
VKIVWSRQARADLHRIQTYLIEQSPKGAERVWLRITQRVAALADMPHAAPQEGDGPMRRLVVHRTPYLVLYRITDGEIRVEAVFHAAREH